MPRSIHKILPLIKSCLHGRNNKSRSRYGLGKYYTPCSRLIDDFQSILKKYPEHAISLMENNLIDVSDIDYKGNPGIYTIIDKFPQFIDIALKNASTLHVRGSGKYDISLKRFVINHPNLDDDQITKILNAIRVSDKKRNDLHNSRYRRKYSKHRVIRPESTSRRYSVGHVSPTRISKSKGVSKPPPYTYRTDNTIEAQSTSNRKQPSTNVNKRKERPHRQQNQSHQRDNDTSYTPTYNQRIVKNTGTIQPTVKPQTNPISTVKHTAYTSPDNINQNGESSGESTSMDQSHDLLPKSKRAMYNNKENQQRKDGKDSESSDYTVNVPVSKPIVKKQTTSTFGKTVVNTNVPKYSKTDINVNSDSTAPPLVSKQHVSTDSETDKSGNEATRPIATPMLTRTFGAKTNTNNLNTSSDTTSHQGKSSSASDSKGGLPQSNISTPTVSRTDVKDQLPKYSKTDINVNSDSTIITAPPLVSKQHVSTDSETDKSGNEPTRPIATPMLTQTFGANTNTNNLNTSSDTTSHQGKSSSASDSKRELHKSYITSSASDGNQTRNTGKESESRGYKKKDDNSSGIDEDLQNDTKKSENTSKTGTFNMFDDTSESDMSNISELDESSNYSNTNSSYNITSNWWQDNKGSILKQHVRFMDKQQPFKYHRLYSFMYIKLNNLHDGIIDRYIQTWKDFVNTDNRLHAKYSRYVYSIENNIPKQYLNEFKEFVSRDNILDINFNTYIDYLNDFFNFKPDDQYNMLNILVNTLAPYDTKSELSEYSKRIGNIFIKGNAAPMYYIHFKYIINEHVHDMFKTALRDMNAQSSMSETPDLTYSNFESSVKMLSESLTVGQKTALDNLEEFIDTFKNDVDNFKKYNSFILSLDKTFQQPFYKLIKLKNDIYTNKNYFNVQLNEVYEEVTDPKNRDLIDKLRRHYIANSKLYKDYTDNLMSIKSEMSPEYIEFMKKHNRLHRSVLLSDMELFKLIDHDLRNVKPSNNTK